MAGYTRTDTTNNIADGNIINAADLDNEFDGVQSAFNRTSGHKHDGSTGEGAPILVLGPAQDVVVGASSVTPKTDNTVDIGSGSLKFKNLHLAGTASIGGALTYGGVTLSNAVTGTGNMVLSTSPTLVTPALGTPSSATLTNATGLPIGSGVSGLGTGVATFLGTPSSANLAAAVTDETGSGSLVFATSPTLVTPALGTPSSATLTNATGLPIDGGTTGTLPVARGGTGVTASTGTGNVVLSNSPTLVTPALGTPSSATLTNATGLPIVNGTTGTLSVDRGGTGATSLTANNVILGNGTSAVQVVAPGTSGNVLTSNGTTWTSTPGAVGDVTLAGTQTLTNKTIAYADNTLTGVAGTTATQTLTNKTLAAVVLNDGYTEEVFAVTGTTPALSPTNGSIQTWTLSGNSTPTAGTWASGQSLTLMVDDGSASTITWTSLAVTWKTDGGAAPTLNTSGFTAIQLWKVDTVIYGARVGDA
jgi:hypothetical protein